MLMRSRFLVVALMLAACWPATIAWGDAWDDVMVGLDYAGFQFGGRRNPLSQGLELQTGRNFQNTVLDFGFNQLTLTGPVTASFTTANRGFRSVDFSISAGAQGNPLTYIYESDVGGTGLRVEGSTLFNVAGSVNQFGWYDLQFEWSVRQSSSSTGRYSNSDNELMDFDIGPIDVSGNLFADLLATVTDPFFESTGSENIFAAFSGRTARENALQSTVSELRAKAAAGLPLSKQEVRELVRMAAEARIHGDDVPSLGFLQQPDLRVVEASGTMMPQVVPEPSTLALLLIPALVCLRRRGRRV